MTEPSDLDRYLPPEAPLAMPYQVIEQPRVVRRSWLAFLRQLAARRAPHE